ncbi:MAG: hypothetical protein HFG80_00325 [Eubacterium sp.]|nr:hypothetical protein [Eubacterium sp.]
MSDKQNESASQKLGELKKMFDDNLITEEEFEAKKKEIIETM